LKDVTSNECCWYPAALFRLEKVPSVARTVPDVLSTWTLKVSKAVVVVVSAVSMCSQKVRVAVVAVEGIEMVWAAESVCVVP